MKKTLFLAWALAALSMFVASNAFAQQKKSGRDGFGYSWLRNDTTGGTAYSWVDIATTGTQATGLGDDNVIGPIPIGFDFTYYWNTYNQIYIGSNGYVMFGRGDNVASGTYSGRSGMPPFPYSDSKNNYVGPFLADLTFINGDGTPAPNAAVYTETQGQKFIVTYNAVPFWTGSTTTQTSGSNTFQLILNAADSSFTIQYKACSGTPSSSYTGNKTSRGFEDINGANGSSFGNNTVLSQLANKRYEVKYPRSSTFQIVDLAAEGVFNRDNGAAFLVQGATNNLVSAVVRNAGTTDINSAFDVNISVETAAGAIVASGPVSVPSLARGARTTVSLPALPTSVAAGDYLVQITTNITGDGVAVNNNIAGEVVVVDTTQSPARFGYDGGVYPGTSQNFGGNSVGVFYEFPNYPTLVTGTEFDMGWVTGLGNYQDSSLYRVRFHLPTASGAPGAAVDSVDIDLNTSIYGDSIGDLFLSGTATGVVRRHSLFLQNPIRLTSGGLYVSITHIGHDNRFFWNRLMADSIAPYSNRIYEIQGGTWGPDRNRDATDYSLRVLTRGVIRITDVAASGIFSANNGAKFFVKGATDSQVSGIVSNLGQVDVTTPIQTTLEVVDAGGNVVSSTPGQIASLTIGSTATVSASAALPSNLAAGTYTVNLHTTTLNDRNAANNTVSGEFNIVDTATTAVIYKYDNANYANPLGFTPYSFGSYYQLPAIPVKVTGVQFDMGWVNTTSYLDSSVFLIKFYQASATPGIPGAAVDSVEISYDTQFAGDSIAELTLQGAYAGPIRRHTLFLTQPVTVTNGGFYLSMQYQGTRPKYFWNRPMVDFEGPFSNRNYLIGANGTWAADRNSGIADYTLRLVTKSSVLAAKQTLPRIALVSYPNPATDVITLKDEVLKQATSIQVLNAQGIAVIMLDRSSIVNGSVTIPVSSLAKGAYVVRATGTAKTVTSRFVKN